MKFWRRPPAPTPNPITWTTSTANTFTIQVWSAPLPRPSRWQQIRAYLRALYR